MNTNHTSLFRMALLIIGICCLSFHTSKGDTARVLVVYTPAAFQRAGVGPAFYRAMDAAINDINASFQRSAVNNQLLLAATVRVSDPQGYCNEELLEALIRVNDGVLDEVHLLREMYYADIVILVVDTSGFCGIAGKALDKSQAFCIVNYDCIKDNYSMARQIGYLYGCGNNTEQSGRLSAWFPNGQGYWNTDDTEAPNSFTTIMGYTDEQISSTQSDFNLIPYWSNPNVQYKGEPTGSAECNNADAINKSSFVVANHYSPAYIYTILKDRVQAYETRFPQADDELILEDVDVLQDGEMYPVAKRMKLKDGFVVTRRGRFQSNTTK